MNTMKTLRKDYSEMLMRSIEEIQVLRATIDKLAPRAEAYDQMKKILNLLPQQSQGMGEDVVWLMQLKLIELNKIQIPD